MGTYEQADQLWHETQGALAEHSDWGIHLNHEMSGESGFNWVKNEKELINLVRLLPYVFSEGDDPNAEDLAAVNRVMDNIENGTINWDAAMLQYNEAYGYDWSVLWWGPFKDLLSNDTDDVESVRQSFWSDYESASKKEGGKEDDSSPIPPELEIEFAKWLTNWA